MEAQNNFLTKYEPKNSKDVLGDQKQFDIIRNFLIDFEKNKDSNIQKVKGKVKRGAKNTFMPNLLIVGNNGIGKTLVTDLILKECKYEKVNADLSGIAITRKRRKKAETKEEEDILAVAPPTSGRSVMTYYMLIQSMKSKNKIALVFDNVSAIFNLKEKEAIKALIKLNNKYKSFPIIIIANGKHSKIVNGVKKMLSYSANSKKDESDTSDDEKAPVKGKKINEIILNNPSGMQINKLINHIAKEEKINFAIRNSDEEDMFDVLVSHSQYDIRRLILVLEELKLIFPKEAITETKLNKYRETSKRKDIDPGIYETTRNLLNHYNGIDDSLLLYSAERATIPLMIHENYMTNLKTQYPKISVEDKLDIICDVSKSISLSDRIDGLIYSSSSWSLQHVHGFYSCALPSFYVNNHAGKLSDMEYYEYTQDYNKASIMRIKNKVIRSIKKNPLLKSIGINDILNFSSILYIMFQNQEFDEITKLLKPYGLTLKSIEAIIKIDKNVKEKQIITGKKRKEFEELLNKN